ncbi:MAG: shikimate dehydrogenase [Candidatus Omnitrophica bacterium]|nr:shikimate dehydrogenase [Candidatus Omnitrophota bacterium]MBU1850781.1 shikimate dehydrogenase [Candidatus Omnitrophota bacterium]
MGETPAKKTYGLLGRNIDYSLSPAMHTAAFEHFNIPATYDLFDISEDGIESFFNEKVLSKRLNGFNVTIPYKTKIVDFFKKYAKKDPTSGDRWISLAKSVNTVKLDRMDDRVEVGNTDILGFKRSLRADAGYDLNSNSHNGDSVFVFGTGGAGRAITIFVMYEQFVDTVYVYDKDEEAISALEYFFKKHSDIFRDKSIKPVNEKDIASIVSKCDLVVNATPMGTREGDEWPVNPDLLKDGAVVYDLVYARETKLVKKAKENGLIAVNGLGMLVNQGAIAFGIWTGKPIEETARIMKDAALRELKKRG